MPADWKTSSKLTHKSHHLLRGKVVQALGTSLVHHWEPVHGCGLPDTAGFLQSTEKLKYTAKSNMLQFFHEQ